MKILSSFDSKFKQKILDKNIKKYWKGNVFVISHGNFYYYFYILLPIVFSTIWLIFYIIVFFYLLSSISYDFRTTYILFWLIVFLILFVPLWFKLFKKYVDYILDFIIITPKNLIHYDQEWILSRKWRTIDVEKIKTITVNKSWLLRSMFNFWNIIILTEWAELWEWEIDFYYIDSPEKIKNIIVNIMWDRIEWD